VVHEKYYLPDEEGFWEATWYRRGPGDFSVCRVGGLVLGFLICTELWFTRHAREYARQGIHLLLCPRATPTASTGTWVAGGRAAANVSGAFCLSSNYNGPDTPSIRFGGTGWIIEPEEGFVLGRTREDSPFLTLDIDTGAADRAKLTYPRYVPD
jgi:N-carbamoylputrescine amidase